MSLFYKVSFEPVFEREARMVGGKQYCHTPYILARSLSNGERFDHLCFFRQYSVHYVQARKRRTDEPERPAIPPGFSQDGRGDFGILGEKEDF